MSSIAAYNRWWRRYIPMRELILHDKPPWYLGFMWEQHAIRCQVWVIMPLNWIIPKVYFWWMRASSGMDNAVDAAYHEGYNAGREAMLHDFRTGFQRIIDK